MPTKIVFLFKLRISLECLRDKSELDSEPIMDQRDDDKQCH